MTAGRSLAEQAVLEAARALPYSRADMTTSLEAAHIDCFLDQVLPHGPDCPRCRGLERNQHKMSCGYAKHGNECDCPFGKQMRRLTEPSTTLAEVQNIADEVGMPPEHIPAIAKRKRKVRRRHD